MRYLIVNGDDFGASPGVNRGVLEAHRNGILTSTSLMVDTPWSEEAALLSRGVPGLSVGLHVHLRAGTGDVDAPAGCVTELERQLQRFQTLMSRPPTHLDSHYNTHRDPSILPHFTAFARRWGLPLREYCPVRYVSKFYGQWGGETHVEQISPDGLLRILDAYVRDGVTELGCHPGYVDAHLRSGYTKEREVEVRTLCSPTVRKALRDRQIELVSFADVRSLFAERSP
jgi:predicted glycoside hydrolase/deacetylase ChbG (UPF0249 family)